jgi:steroid delta-isomerase-like uncharacterized protein
MSLATKTAERIVDAFNRHDVSAFAACFAEDGVQIHPFFPEPQRGREAIRAAESRLFDSFDDIDLRLTNLVENGQWAAAEFAVQATHTKPLPMPDGTSLPPTGRVVKLTMASFMHLDDNGQILEAHRYQDNLAFLRALGIMG